MMARASRSVGIGREGGGKFLSSFEGIGDDVEDYARTSKGDSA